MHQSVVLVVGTKVTAAALAFGRVDFLESLLLPERSSHFSSQNERTSKPFTHLDLVRHKYGEAFHPDRELP